MPENFDYFMELIIKATQKNIPFGYRSFFMSCWSPESKTLLRAYKATGDPDVATALLQSLDCTRLQLLIDTGEATDFMHSSHKARALHRPLDDVMPSHTNTASHC